MRNTPENCGGRKNAGRYGRRGNHEHGAEKFSGMMALLLGAVVAAEVMVAGAMILNFDFSGADIIALILVYVVLYSGAVALLTDQ
ncbi:MAG: hypothetical protein LUF78_00600 [Clostridiales bacterium]|nr:hypothetical protein [Clostridiales bacterium]MCD8153195.1 hypothetical protein [Clostridiales bacterium]